jgi:hypothetical protein
VSGKTEIRIGLGSQTDSNIFLAGRTFNFPVIDLQFGKRGWIALRQPSWVAEKGKLCSRVDKE